MALLAFFSFYNPTDNSGASFIVGSIAALPVLAASLALRIPARDFRPGLALILSAIGLALSVFVLGSLWLIGNDGCGGGAGC